MDAGAVLLAHGNLRIKRTRFGLMAYNVNDQYIGRSFDRYGEYSHGEALLFAQIIKPGSFVVDVGANIGAHTVFFANLVGHRGHVVAIEPQRTIYHLLCANLALNELSNVHTIFAGAGRAQGRAHVRAFDYNEPGNFGGVALVDRGGEPIDLISIDSLQLPQCNFIKIDVEGYKSAVIAGAVETIAHFKPILYVENDRRWQSADLIRIIHDLGYISYWHLPPLFREDNFFGNRTNLWPGIVSIDMLCVPSNDLHTIRGMKQVTGPDDWPFPI